MVHEDKRELDEINWKILEELQKNARISFRKLADKVNLSPTAVIERVKRMEDDGTIAGYTAVINPRRVGYQLTALISMQTDYGNPDAIVHEALSKVPEVISCWSVTGTNDFLLEIHVPTLEFLEDLLIELSKHGKLTTSIVLPSSVTKRRLEHPRNSMR